MHWGERNGPPYPLTSWQKKVGDAVAKGRVALDSAMSNYAQKAREKNEKRRQEYLQRVADRQHDILDMESRKNNPELKEIRRLASKNARDLTDDELRRMNERKRLENEFEKNYGEDIKVGKETANEMKKTLTRQLVTPTLVALGRAVVIASVQDSDKFESIATEQLFKAYGYNNTDKKQKDKNNNQNNNQNNNKNQNNNNQKNNQNNNKNQNNNNQNNKKKKNGSGVLSGFMATTPTA